MSRGNFFIHIPCIGRFDLTESEKTLCEIRAFYSAGPAPYEQSVLSRLHVSIGPVYTINGPSLGAHFLDEFWVVVTDKFCHRLYNRVDEFVVWLAVQLLELHVH